MISQRKLNNYLKLTASQFILKVFSVTFDNDNASLPHSLDTNKTILRKFWLPPPGICVFVWYSTCFFVCVRINSKGNVQISLILFFCGLDLGKVRSDKILGKIWIRIWILLLLLLIIILLIIIRQRMSQNVEER